MHIEHDCHALHTTSHASFIDPSAMHIQVRVMVCMACTDRGLHKNLLYCFLQTATVRRGDIPPQRRRHSDPAAPPPSEPQSPPCLVLGPGGHTLALATETHSEPRLQGRTSIYDDSSQSTMYTAFLNEDEIAGARGALPMDMIARSMGRTLSRPHSLTRRK